MSFGPAVPIGHRHADWQVSAHGSTTCAFPAAASACVRRFDDTLDGARTSGIGRVFSDTRPSVPQRSPWCRAAGWTRGRRRPGDRTRRLCDRQPGRRECSPGSTGDAPQSVLRQSKARARRPSRPAGCTVWLASGACLDRDQAVAYALRHFASAEAPHLRARNPAELVGCTGFTPVLRWGTQFEIGVAGVSRPAPGVPAWRRRVRRD